MVSQKETQKSASGKNKRLTFSLQPTLNWAEDVEDAVVETLASSSCLNDAEQNREHTVLAVACCALITDGLTTRFQCKFPDCGREYASRDAVRKHCRIRHLAWCVARLLIPSLDVERGPGSHALPPSAPRGTTGCAAWSARRRTRW